jgi:hypothetical protein
MVSFSRVPLGFSSQSLIIHSALFHFIVTKAHPENPSEQILQGISPKWQ